MKITFARPGYLPEIFSENFEHFSLNIKEDVTALIVMASNVIFSFQCSFYKIFRLAL